MRTAVVAGFAIHCLVFGCALADASEERPAHNSIKVPEPDPAAAQVPRGYRVEVVVRGLTYPTSVEFDEQGTMFLAEAGYSYGEENAEPRILRISRNGEIQTVTGEFIGPINDLLWFEGQLIISHRGKISRLLGDKVIDLVSGLPSSGDHHNNQLTAGPDGKLYFGQGTVTNSGVVGVDNYEMGWLAEHPDLHDVPAQDVQLVRRTFESTDPLKGADKKVSTSAFHPFGKSSPNGAVLSGSTKAGGTILRMNPDGSGLEVYAWGLRNPFGVMWSPDKKLYASENGMDIRGSRPVANDTEDLYIVRRGAWYGWPDYASGEPITMPKFKPTGKSQPQFLMVHHPPVEKPWLTFPKHSAVAKIDFSPGKAFGHSGDMFVAFYGHMAPMTGQVDEHAGHRVVRVDVESRTSEVFFSGKRHHGTSEQSTDKRAAPQTKERLHSDAHGHGESSESATAGPRRLVDVKFSPEGDALYVVDFGTMLVTEEKIAPIPGTGVLWRVLPQDAESSGPPADLSALNVR